MKKSSLLAALSLIIGTTMITALATKQAKGLCSSMKKINPSLKTKSIVYPASKAPVTTVNKKWIPVSYRIESSVN